ncbi:MAG: hypothetical protein ABEH86_08445 [Haloarcula sp.]
MAVDRNRSSATDWYGCPPITTDTGGRLEAVTTLFATGDGTIFAGTPSSVSVIGLHALAGVVRLLPVKWVESVRVSKRREVGEWFVIFASGF